MIALTDAQARALRALAGRQHALTATDLSRILYGHFDAASTCGRLAQRLEAMGLVLQCAATNAHAWALTPKGKEALGG